MIRIKQFFPPEKKDQGIMTQPYTFKENKYLRNTFQKQSQFDTTLFITKQPHQKKCFYDNKQKGFKKIQTIVQDKIRILENKVLGIPLSEKDCKMLKQQINFFNYEDGYEAELVGLSMERMFEEFIKFKKDQIKSIALKGCLRGKLIKPFLILYQKLESQSDQGFLYLENGKVKQTLFNLFTKFRPKENIENEIADLDTKYQNLYVRMFEKYEKVPFYSKDSEEKLSQFQSNFEESLRRKNMLESGIKMIPSEDKTSLRKTMKSEQSKEQKMIKLHFKESGEKKEKHPKKHVLLKSK